MKQMMKMIIQVNDRPPEDKKFFERQLERALEGFEPLATHASLKLSRQEAENAADVTQPLAYRCRVALAFRNWGIVVAESSAETAARAMERALHQLRLAVQQVVLPESRTPILARGARLVCC
jgi:hypothetical protein